MESRFLAFLVLKGTEMPRPRISNSQWAQVEPLLPGRKGTPGRTGFDNRKALEGILWILRTGAPWRDLPEEYGKWGTVYQRFRRWSDAGVFDQIFETTQGDLDMRSVQVDGSYVKVHQHGTGAPKVVARPKRPAKRKKSGRVEAG